MPFYYSFLLATGLTLLAIPSQAQTTFSFGPRLGLNAARAHFTGQYSDTPVNSRPGLEAGLVGNLSFGHWALQPAVLFTQKGYRTHGYSSSPYSGNPPVTYDEEVRYNYVAAPLNLSFALRADGQGVQIFGGAYVGVLAGGHFTGITRYYGLDGLPLRQDDNYSGKIVSSSAVDYPDRSAQRWDYGLQAGLGYRYRGLLFQAGYSAGLRNLGMDITSNGYYFPGHPHYNRAFQTSLTYLFGPK